MNNKSMKFHRAWAVHFTKNPIVGPFGLFRNRHDGYRGGWLTALFQVQLAVVERSGWSLATSSEQLKQRQRSVMRAIRLDSRLAGHRLHRVGIAGNTVFLQPTIKNSVQLWSLHTLFPSSWRQIFCLPVEEVFYTFPSCSYSQPKLFVLVVAIFKGEQYPRISIFEIDRDSGDRKEYRLAEQSSIEFDGVPLENAILGCGAHGLHIYDRSIVMGSIPYWNIKLGNEAFTLERDDVVDDSSEKCSRFPIAIDSDSIGSNTMTFSTSSRGNVPSSMDTVDDTEEQMVVEQNLPTATEPENQVDTLATRMANNVGPIGSDQQCVNPAATPRGASTRVPMAERWETSAPEVNLKRTVESIIAVVFPRVDEKASLSSTTNVDHVDWHCPRKLMYQGVEVECPTAVILQDVIPNAPFGALKFSSPYDLSRLLTILSQSHIPESWRTARLLDRTYDITSPTGLGLAWSFYRQNCIHLTLASVSEAGCVIPDHPSRSNCDPYNLASIADIARRYAETHPWTKSSWTELKPRKNLIILPVGFERVVDCLKTESQKAVVLKKPEEMLPEWFVEDYSSIVLFSLAEFAGTTRWRGAWTLLMQQVARGAELMILAGPENDREWKRSLDMLRDLCEETVAQRPSLRTHIRCLLPYRSQYEMIGAGFRAATYEQGKLFTESAAKRFWASTMAQHSAFISLAPFRRKAHQNAVKRGAGHTPYHQRNTPNYQAQSSAQRGQSQHRGGSRYRGHHNRGGYTARKPLTEMPIHKIGNQMYKLVPIKDSKRNPFPLRGLSSRGGRRF